MNAEFRRVKAIFLAAVEKPDPTERDAYLREACGPDEDLRRQVDALLGKHAQAGSFLESPLGSPVATVDEQPLTEGPGAVIGPYKLLEQIGEGGFGVVFMAEQTQPVRRKVALKILKAGMDTRQVVARFEAERQALAIMDHPNIAKVFDGGWTGSTVATSGLACGLTSEAACRHEGRPYFVMELVKGVPITEFCDQNHLTPRQRLELFLPVCQAVQHAHHKGIIHRDLKPSNVLVTVHDTTPVPKVIDFGVAKALGQELTDKTLFTGFAQMIGTPLYMSPEQAGQSGLDIDTRSDIYSLGVLLYELLTGTTPFTNERFKQAAYDEIRRIIREEEPPKPSTRLSESKDSLPSISAQRHTEPAKLTKLVRGELDWIVMKSLEKDRNRRYETANGFAQDIQRYLADEPVQACPPSAGYRLRKFWRRNKRPLATAAAVGLVVLLAVGSIGWMVRDRAAQRAETEAHVDLSLKETERLLSEGNWPEATVWLTRAEGSLSGGVGGALHERARELRKDLDMVLRLDDIGLRAFDGSPNLARVDADYALAFREYGIDLEVLDVEEAAARIRGRAIWLDLAMTLVEWATYRKDKESRLVLARAVDADDWRNQVWEAIAARKREPLVKLAASEKAISLPPRMLPRLGMALSKAGAHEEAIAFMRLAQRRYPGDYWINFQLAYCLAKTRWATWEAISFYRAALAASPKSLLTYRNLAAELSNLGQVDEAIAVANEAIHLKPEYARAHSALAWALCEKGLLDEAIAAYQNAIRHESHYAVAHHDLGLTLEYKGLYDEALAAFQNAIRHRPAYAAGHYRLGMAYRRQGRLDEAIAAYRQALRHEPDHGPARWCLGQALHALAWRLATMPDRQPEDDRRALELAREAVALAPNYVFGWTTLGVAHYRTGNWKAAVETLEKAQGMYANSAAWIFLSMAYAHLNDLAKARKFYNQAVGWRLGVFCTDQELRRACAEAAKLLGVNLPPALREPPVLAPGPKLLLPAAGATLENRSRNGFQRKPCEFDWSDIPGATRYHYYVWGAFVGPDVVPWINDSALTASSYRHEAGVSAANGNRLGWRWKVRAEVNGVWTDWSEERSFDIAPSVWLSPGARQSESGRGGPSGAKTQP